MSANTITMGKQYRTRDGRPVRLLAVDENLNCGGAVVGVVTDGGQHLSVWKASGENVYESRAYDLIEVSLKMDDQVIVSDGSRFVECRRRYAGEFTPDGSILCWDSGADSWATGGDLTYASSWETWRLPTEEELK